MMMGTVMRCHARESTKHFVSECPHREDVQSANLAVHLTLIPGSASEQQHVLTKTLNKGILDTACTKTVAGQAWVDEY